MTQSSQFTRRKFLQGSALIAAGAGIGLVGCAPNGGSSDSGSSGQSFSGSWDEECDVIVIGSGTATVAAIAAAEFGAESVIIFEKSPNYGGTTAISGGGVGIPLTHIATEAGVQDNIEDVLTYYKNASGGRADETLVRSYVDNGERFLRFTEDLLGFTWGFTQQMYQDYYEPVEGYLGFGRGNISVQAVNGEPSDGSGSSTWAVLYEYVDASDKIDLRLDTPVSELIVDDDGNVVGVIVEVRGDTLAIGANKAVVIGTGGFEHNKEMRMQYLPYPILSLTSVETNTGDGHKMGMKIGADLAHMDRNWGLPAFLPEADVFELLENNDAAWNLSGFDAGMYSGLPGSIIVNRKGERFGNECASYDPKNRTFGQFDSSVSVKVNIPAYFICDSAYAAAYRVPGQEEAGQPMPDYFMQADTLDELAEKLDIDAAGLLAEVASFNEHAAKGEDPKFNRGGHEFDINTAAIYAGMREDLPNPVLSPVEVAPFYGALYVPGTFGTCGGLKINEHAQVLSVDGKPIGNLYAVGNCSAGVSGGAYCHGGMTVGSGSAMSIAAMRHVFEVTD